MYIGVWGEVEHELLTLCDALKSATIIGLGPARWRLVVAEGRPGSWHEVGREQPHRAGPPWLGENQPRIEGAKYATSTSSLRHIDGVVWPAVTNGMGMILKPLRNRIGADSEDMAYTKPAEEHM